MKILNLISGNYTPAEAREVLLKLIDIKISFHKIKNLKSQVNFEKADVGSQARIKELLEIRAQIVSLIQEAIEGNHNVEVESILNVAIEGKAYEVSHVQGQEVAYSN
ncbi:hypothetical protein ABID22_003236 [Pontibacter aydingkolensis]|uniref:Uncharacterized protein n=1 Tax=Pontibacter aydingkolensis TaxID=1911536 RepID=A0ABS7CS80_9BACT|nr:hypothetical protein [Pontibacter aydingkolensis]MBW7466685.1 hypothetical protein [Pontibacter aydingkolensis]